MQQLQIRQHCKTSARNNTKKSILLHMLKLKRRFDSEVGKIIKILNNKSDIIKYLNFIKSVKFCIIFFFIMLQL